jgi:hypothetical protein
MMNVLVSTTVMHYENLSLYRYVSENSAYALCADTRNFFVVDRILLYE